MQDLSNKQGSDIKAEGGYALYGRLILSLMVIAALIGHIIDAPLDHITTLVVASSLLIYTLISYVFNRHTFNHWLLLTDGLLMAIVAGELGYSLWPCVTLLSVLYFSALTRGGVKQWLLINLGVIIGLAISFFALKHQTLASTSPYYVDLIIAVGALLYLSLYALENHHRLEHIEDKEQQLASELKDQKLRIYEISRYIPKPIWERIEGKKKVKIERKPITVFFSDIVGFSRLSEELEAETLSEVLSSYLNEMNKIVGEFNGTIDKFIGDAIMVTFGDDSSVSKGVKHDATACVSMAISMGKRMRELQPIWAEMGIKKPLQIRIGINSGYCTVGTFGTSRHMDHTALGVHVNLASRLESAGQPGDILVSHETWNLIKDTILCKDKGKIKAKGFTHPVQVFQVINHRRELGSSQSYFSETTDGFSMHLDMQKVKNYDCERVVNSLEVAAKKIRDRFPNN